MISILICTWNRSVSLGRTLESLTEVCTAKDVEWELLVINNNSSDNTSNVICQFADRLPIREVFEKQQGLSHARNRAVREAQGSHLIFTDDDILFERQWLLAYSSAFRNYPQASYYGGPIRARFESTVPSWLRDNEQLLAPTYGVINFGPETRAMPLAPRFLPYGGNMAFRADILQRTQFDSRLGREGGAMLVGEETALFAALSDSGHCGVWVADAQVEHCIPSPHLTTRYVWRSFEGLGRSAIRMTGPTERVAKLLGYPRWRLRHFATTRAMALALWAVGDRRWLKAYTTSACQLGMLKEECRAN